MNKIIDLLNKLSGLKTYLAGAAAILSGAGGLLGEFLNAKGLPAFLGLVANLPNDPNWMMLLGGLALVGLGHKLDKFKKPDPAPEPSPEQPAA